VKRVLVVDDDYFIKEIVSTALAENGFAVSKAGNGLEALEIIQKERVDMVILDVVMPKMDGWQLLQELRAKPETAYLPVIFLTTRAREKDRVKGFQLGVDDFLAKPFNVNELVLRVKRMLERVDRENRMPLGQNGLQGSITDIGLASLLMMLEVERKTGLLRLAREDHRCVLYMQEGNIIRARSNNRSLTSGLRVVFDSLNWKDGQFQFIAREVDEPVEIKASTTTLIMEAARQFDENARTTLQGSQN